MKKLSLLILLAVSGLSVFGQSPGTPLQSLAVEKLITTTTTNSTSSETVTLVFKPGSNLKIKTSDGMEFYARDYAVVDGALLINQADTLQLDQISRIRGRVYGNEGRKILGLVIAAGSIPAGFFSVFILAWGGWPIVPTAIPFVGMMVGGFRLMGARRFDTEEKWELLVVEQNQSVN